jgi:hypothetical protein
MTEKERGAFDAMILSMNASLRGIALQPDIQAWVTKRLTEKAADASIRVTARIQRER